MMKWGIAAVGVVACLGVVSLYAPQYTAVKYETPEAATQVAGTTTVPEEVELTPVADNRPVVQHVPLPPQVKNIYMSACVAGTPSFRQDLIDLMARTEVNSVIIDIKDYSGSISFDPVGEAWQGAWENAGCGARDMKELIATLHEQGIFVIGRITVFQDPYYTSVHPEHAVKRADGVTVWQDYKGLSFVDVGARPYWDHVIELAVESYNIGFDELNFDYVRYPSDGNMRDISFPNSLAGEYGADKQANLEAFFSYLYDAMTDPERFNAVRHENTGRTEVIPYTSADLFGMTTTNTDDLSIGQIIERAVPYFDFIAPMVYPSHYPDGSFGYGDPNQYPYEIVNIAMAGGVERLASPTTVVNGFKHTPQVVTNASGTQTTTGLYEKPIYPATKLRTWIQDFDYGGDYDAADVRAQIQASYDAGVDSWMIWAPSNRYTEPALLGPGVYEVTQPSATTTSST